MIPWRLIGSLLLLIAVLSGVSAWQHHEWMVVRAERDQERKDFKAYRDQAESQAREQAARRQAMNDELRRVRQESQHDAERKLRAVQAQRDAAVRESRGMRDDFAELAAQSDRCAGDPAPVGGGLRTGPPGRVLADVFGRVDDAATELAVFADGLSIALEACQREHAAARGVR